MNQTILHFSANEQALTGSTYHFASNTVHYIKAVFDLGQNWQGYDSIRAVWWSDYACISTVPIHTIILLDGDANTIRRETYLHKPEPQPEPEPEAATVVEEPGEPE